MNPEISPRLRWACRRGMLELDILLLNFLENAYAALPEQKQAIFLRLLKCEDQDLFEWLTGKKTPQDSEIKMMVEMILQQKRVGGRH